MYRVLRSKRKQLIVTDEVVALTATNNDVDPRQIEAAIQIAEERFIKQAICKDLYDDIRDQKNVVVTSLNKTMLQDLINDDLDEYNEEHYGDDTEKYIEHVTLAEGEYVNSIELVTNTAYSDLWYEHLWKATAECVVYIASPTNFSRFAAQGEMENNPRLIATEAQGSASVGLDKMKWKMDKMLMDRIDPLISSCREWIEDNHSDYPLYNCRRVETVQTSANANGVSFQRKSGWIHGIYDTGRSGRCTSCDNPDQL